MALPKKSHAWKWILASVVGVLLTSILVSVLWKKDVDVVVQQHVWTREIDIQTLSPKSESAWCDQKPTDAYSVSRTREVRSTRQIPDGQTCSEVSHDNGDGTFTTKNQCRTKYRSEPIYDDKCYYTVDRWQVTSTERSQGTGVSPEPSWPAVHLRNPGTRVGCDREGARRENLVVHLQNKRKQSEHWQCSVDGTRWRALVDGSEQPMRVRVVTGGADCDSLGQPRT